MSLQQPSPRPSSIFDAHELVVQSHPLLTGNAVPQFGDTGQWNLNGVIRRPARLPACAWTLVFSHGLAEPSWNLLAREVSMIMLNPRHPSVTAAGMSLKPAPAHPTTVISELSHIRQLVRLAEASKLPPHIDAWNDNDLRRLIRNLREQLSGSAIRHYIATLKMLHQYGPALSCQGLRSDPWTGTSARAAARTSSSAVTTPVIPPEQWFPLIRAAWTYVHTFAPDILRTQQHYRDLLAQATAVTSDHDTCLDRWLADPASPIPIHATDPLGHREVNWRLLTLMLGWKPSCSSTLFGRNRTTSLQRIARVEHAVARGHSTTTGVVDDLTQVEHRDGVRMVWHPGLAPQAIGLERRMLRNACYTLVVGLSMMRDSEIHEITPGSIADYYGNPAIKSTKGKHDPSLPIKHWWITEPVAEAIAVAEQLSERLDRLFPPLHRKSADVSRSHQMLDAFINHVNATTAWTGLDPIPPDKARPHMFRRTMAMLTDQFPGSEIALGIQLKHIASRALANRSTQGYANADSSWAEHLESAIDAARFRRIEDLYQAHKTGEPIGYGPGADRITQSFNGIQHTIQTRGGDATVERAMLRKARISIRFGTLNHCVMDEKNPAGAACLDNAVIPAGHKGPLQDRCRPDRCVNSIIGPEHLPIWATRRRTLLTLIDTPSLPTCRKAVLQRELGEVDAVLNKAPKEQP
ncbi:hypothetical protein DSM43518_02311 [Mycobacterium marinum]|uniref:integrase n=1 Tax=Mycobacterium marinum TaxID=1781 RepID=UPI000E3DA365|nr:integrase [Mycobacterium marinum]RFZ10397.1 hypothetical protein DSM43518_02311 [Mycobacterium marinum]